MNHGEVSMTSSYNYSLKHGCVNLKTWLARSQQIKDAPPPPD